MVVRSSRYPDDFDRESSANKLNREKLFALLMIIFASSSVLVTIPHPAAAAPANHSPTSSSNAASPSIIANFTFTPTSPDVNVPVYFDASSSFAPTFISFYQWSWGDGSLNPDIPLESSNYRTVSHAFQLNGTFTVTLTVFDSNGASATTSHIITVNMINSNTPPAALFTYAPTKPIINQMVTFDASASRDPDGDPVISYQWTGGAAAGGIVPGTLFNASGAVFTHSFNVTGVYVIILTVTDNHQLSSNQYTLIAVTRIPYVPGVKAGDYGKYYFSTNQTSNSGLLAVSVNVTQVVGTKVTSGFEVLYPNGTAFVAFNQTADLYSGVGALGSFFIDVVAANLTAGDGIFSFLGSFLHFNYTTTKVIAGASREITALTYGSSGSGRISLEYDRLTGLLVYLAFESNGQGTEIFLGDTNAWAPTGNEAPLPLFYWTPGNPNPGQSVSFDASRSYDPDHDAISYLWDFGDGGPTSTLVQPTHTYAGNETYVVTLTTSDGLAGGSASATKAIQVGAPRVHDVAVTVVSASTYSATVGQTVDIFVQVTDVGAFPENVTVQVTAGGFFVTSQTVDLSAGGSQSLTFAWDTHGSTPGPYTISAYAVPVPGETNTANNYFTDGTVTLTNVAQPDFQIAANPQTFAMPLGQSRNVAITLQSVSGFSGTIHVSASYDTTHLSVNPTSTDITLAASGASSTHSFNLTIATGSTQAQGNYQVIVTGTNGTVQHSVGLGVTLGTPLPPTITSVSAITTDTHQAITIQGSGFGYAPPTFTLADGSVDTGVNGTSPSIAIWDNLTSTGWTWQAGHWGNLIGIYITSWSDTKIVIGGFGTLVGSGTRNANGVCIATNWAICVGDRVTVGVWGPNNSGIAYFNLTVTMSGGSVVATVPVGTYPVGVGYDSGNGYVYVANGASSTVSVISGTTVVGAVPVGADPRGVGYDSGNGYVYVANFNATNCNPTCGPPDSVSVISGTTVVATITVGSSPRDLGYDSRNGYVYVANFGSSSVSVINGTTVVATIPVGNYPYAVGYDSGNGYVYVTNYYSSSVSVINGTTVVATVPVETFPYAVGYDSGNGYVYVANYLSNSVSVISGTVVVATVPVGTHPDGVGYDSGNGYIYVANGDSSSVSVINGTTVVATIPVGTYPDGVGYDSGNGYVYVANAGSNTVSVISTTTSVSFNYSLANSGPVSIQQGTSGSVTLTARLTSGLAKSVVLSCVTPLPSGISCTSFNPGSVTPSSFGATSTLMVSVASSVAPGSYMVDVTGLPLGATTSPTTVSVSVTRPTTFDFSLSVPSPNSLTVVQGSTSGTSSIVATLISGTATPLTFTASGLPSGVTAIFTNNQCSPTCTVTVSFSASATATLGTYSVSIQASGGGANHSAGLSLIVSPPVVFDFSLSTPLPGSLTVAQGGTSPSSSITATLVSGTTAPLTFSASGLPNGVTATFANNSCSPTCTATVSFSATPTAATGTTIATIDASGGGASHSTSLSLTVRASSCTSNCGLGPWTQTSSYPLDAERNPCVVDSGYVYCVGGTAAPGGCCGFYNTNAVYFASLSSSGVGAWTKSTSLPTAIADSACVANSAIIYCVGGFNATGTTVSSVYYASLSSGGVGSWTATTSYPVPTHDTGCVVDSDTIYCIGGYSKPDGSDFRSTAYYATLSANGVGPWTQTTSYPTNIGGQSCVVDAGVIYCVAGQTQQQQTGSNLTNATYYASLSSSGIGSWTKTTSYPTSSGSGCTVSSGFIYCVAGYPSTSAVYFAPISSSGIGAWGQTTSYPIVDDGPKCIALSGYEYCVAGNENGRLTNAVYFSQILVPAPAITSTSVSCSPSSISIGSSSTCTATITGSNPAGTVAFTQSGSGTVMFSASSCTLSSGSCSVTVTGTAAGSSSIKATYSGDSHNAGSEGSISVNIVRASASVSVSCSPSSVNVGRFTTCSVSVTGSSASGQVTFTTSSSTGTFTPSSATCTLSSGACSVTYADASTSSLTATITASYNGDAGNSPSSGTFPLNVSKPAGVLAVGSTSATITNGGVVVNQSVTGISVTITGSTAANGTPVGVTTQTLSSQPSSVSTPSIVNPSYYDVLVTGVTTGNAQVCVSFSSASASTTLQYWSGTAWTSASNITVNGTTVCGTIPVSALTGTSIALGNTVQPVPPNPTDYTLVYIGAGGVAVIVVLGALLALRKRRRPKQSTD